MKVVQEQEEGEEEREREEGNLFSQVNSLSALVLSLKVPLVCLFPP